MTPLLSFTVFKDKILDGSKTQTIRKLRKRPIKQGDRLYLYWHCRQKDCEKIGEAICTDTFLIQLHREYWLGKSRLLIFKFIGDKVIPHWQHPSIQEASEIIMRDGFKDADEMLQFFKRYPLPDVFQVIRWEALEK
jgi:hypothetical protein